MRRLIIFYLDLHLSLTINHVAAFSELFLQASIFLRAVFDCQYAITLVLRALKKAIGYTVSGVYISS